MKKNILKCISTIDEFDIDEFNKLGIGVEIQDFTEPNLSKSSINSLIREYKDRFKNFEYIKALHGPFLDLRIASPDEEIRKVSYNKYLRTLEIADELDIDYIVFHSQISPFLNEPRLAELNNLQAKIAWESLTKEMGDYRGTIVIENIFEPTPDMLKDLISAIDLPNVKINLDFGHAKLGRVSLETWIRELKDYLVYIHLHSNDGIYDTHIPPSELQIKALNSLLTKYEINPVISLEYKSESISDHIEMIRE